MSTTYDLYCPETGYALWIGQGSRLSSNGMAGLYAAGGGREMDELVAFLNFHRGKSLVFDSCYALDLVDHKEWRYESPDSAKTDVQGK